VVAVVEQVGHAHEGARSGVGRLERIAIGGGDDLDGHEPASRLVPVQIVAAKRRRERSSPGGRRQARVVKV